MLNQKFYAFLFSVLFVTTVGIYQPLLYYSFYKVDVIPTKTIYSESHSLCEYVTTSGSNGNEIVKSNVLNDGNMEEVETTGEPEGFLSYGTGINHVNHSYQDDVYSGSYGGFLSSEGTTQFASEHFSSRNLSTPEKANLSQIITLNLWYNAKESPHYAQGADQYIGINFNTSLGTYYIVYFVSRIGSLPINGSTSGYYDIRGPLNTWINIDRNLTLDFEQLFPAVPLISTYVHNMYFWVDSIINPSGPTVMLYDEVSITNNTGFNYFSNNGDFELGNSAYWSHYETGPAYLYTTTNDYTEGNRAMNMTTHCISSNASSYLDSSTSIYDGWGSVPKSWPYRQPEDLVFSFDWKYYDTPGLGSQSSYFYISATNGTYDYYINFVLGIEDDDFLGTCSNYSYPTSTFVYIVADGFGIRDTWNHFTFDAHEILTTFNFIDAIPFYVGFYMYNNYVDGNINQLLIDNFQIVTYPSGDASFEGNIIETTTDPFNFWRSPSSHIYANITSDAFDENYAANITSNNGAGNIYIYKNTFLPVDENLFTDFYWRLDQLTDVGANAISYIKLEIDDSYYLYYVLGSNSYSNPVNNTDNCYILIDEHNQIGTWNNLFRNLNADITVGFGAGNHNITQIFLSSNTTGTETVSTIFDYIHFVRDIEGPLITNLDVQPFAPEYDDTVDVSIEVTDNIEVQEVLMYVRIDSGVFVATPMTFISGYYIASITAYDYDTEVSYYFEAIDIFGHLTSLGSDINPYSYIITDTVNPVLAFEVPPESQILSGTITFNFTDAYDLGSGIQSFEIYINESVVLSDVMAPESYSWNTETFTNGDYLVGFRLIDHAGNIKEIYLLYTIYNPQTLKEIFIAFATSPLGIFIWSAVGVVILGIIVLVMIIRARRKKKLTVV